MNNQPYELSIWKDIQFDNSGLSYFKDEKVAIIGSDTMTSPFKAYDVTLKRQSNGDRTLTFSMLYKIKENGEDIDNPFFELITNETKLKFRDGEAYSPFYRGQLIVDNTITDENNQLIKLKDTEKRWSDFIVKTIDKDSTTYVANIVAKELHVNELSKNGWSITLNTELENNYGTVTELAEKVLEGSNWIVDKDSYSPIEGIEEPLFEYEVTTKLAADGIKNGEKAIALEGQKIYFFYKDVEFDESYKENEQGEPIGCWKLKKADSYQILYFGVDKDIKSVLVDDNLVIIDDDYKYNYEINKSPSQETTVQVIPKHINGRRIQNKQRVQYESVLDKYVDVYINGDNKIYGYKETEYSVSPIVQNHIVNSTNFTSNTGWKNSDPTKSDPILTLYPEPKININEKNEASLDDTATENILIFDNKNSYINNGPTISKLRVIDGEEYIIRFRGRWINNGEPSKKDYNLEFQLKEDSLTDVVFSEKEIINIKSDELGTDGFFAPKESRENPEEKKLYIDEQGYGYYKFKVNSNSLENHNIIIVIGLDDTTTDNTKFYLSDIQLFKYEVGNREVKKIENNNIVTYNYSNSILFPGDSPKSNIEDKYIYYEVNEYDEIKYYTSLPNGYEPDKADTSVRFFETRESNYFNNIQSLAELFEVWVGFDIEHYQDGGTVYELVEDAKDEQGEDLILYQPKKTVKFYQYSPTGKDNYAGFKYGINLKGIKRTIDSNSIASKVIVKPNNQEYATDGMCTIARAPSNQTGETEILNFDYYIHQGLLSETTVINDLYGTINNHLRYYPKIKKCNEIIEENSLLVSKYSNTISELKKFYDLYDAEVVSYNNEINELTLTYQNFNPEDEKREQYKNEIARLLILRNTAETNRNNIKTTVTVEKENGEKVDEIIGSLQQYLDWTEIAQKNIDEQTEKKEKLREILYNKYYRFIQEGTWTDESYVDDELYYLEATKISAVSAFPQVSYVINVLSVENLEGYESYKFNVGDRTYIEDVEFFGYALTSFDTKGNVRTPYRMEVIVTEHNQNYDDPTKTTITVKNYKNQFEELFQKITATTQSLQYKTGEYTRAANAITPTGEIKVSTLEQSFKNNSMILSSSDNQSVILDTGTGIEVIDNKNTNNRVRVVGGGIFISNDGGGTWSNAISGNGINTRYLIAGQIDVSKINIMEGSIPYFRWDKNGISAYQVDHTLDNQNEIDSLPTYDLGRYVRFNQYGIYAVGAGGKSGTAKDFEEALSNQDTYYKKLKYIENNANFSLTWKGLTITGANGDSETWQAVHLDAAQGLTLTNGDYNFSKEAESQNNNFRNYYTFDELGNKIVKAYKENDKFPVLAIGQFPDISVRGDPQLDSEGNPIVDEEGNIQYNTVSQKVYGLRLRNEKGFVTLATDNHGDLWVQDKIFVGPWSDKTIASSTTGLNAETITLEKLKTIKNDQFIAELSENPDLVEHSIRIWAGAPHDEIESSPFLVLENGTVIASNAYISGNIQADSGNISGLLTIGDGRHGIDGSSEANPIIWGKDKDGTYKFWIDSDGILHAEGAEISGTIGAAETTVEKILIPNEKSGGIDSDSDVRIWINEEPKNETGNETEEDQRKTSVFYVTKDGHLHTKEAYLDGNLYITKDENGNYQSGICNGTNKKKLENGEEVEDNIILYAGAQSGDRESAVFIVDKSGNVIAKSLNLGEGTLTAADAKLNGTLKIGTIVIDGTNGIIRTANSSSVAGWSIDEDGNAQFNNINARGEIKSAVFTHNSINTMGGDLYLTPVYYDYENTVKTDKGNYEIIVDESVYNNEVWAENGNITFSALIDGKEYNNIPATLTKKLEETIYSFIITPKTNDLNIDSTKTPTNFSINSLYGCGIRLAAGDTNGPNITITDISNNTVVLTQIGSLEGVSDANFGKLEGYGLYSQYAYLTGSLFLPNAGITDKGRIAEEDESSPVRIWAGAASENREEAPFRVTQDGTLYAEKGIFSGVVQAENSTFSGWLQTTGILIDDNQATFELLDGGFNEYTKSKGYYYSTNGNLTLGDFLQENYPDEITDYNDEQKSATLSSIGEIEIESQNGYDKITFVIGKGIISFAGLVEYVPDFNLEGYNKYNEPDIESDNAGNELIETGLYYYYKEEIKEPLPDYYPLSKFLKDYNLDLQTFNELNNTDYKEDTIFTEVQTFYISDDGLAPDPIFYVAYDRNNKTIFPEHNDKIIQIDRNGLSIWEGGLNVYSDYASGWRGDKLTNEIEAFYGYTENNQQNYPYIKSIDSEGYHLYSTALNIGKFSNESSSFINIKDGKISFVNYSNQSTNFITVEKESYEKRADWRLYNENEVLVFDYITTEKVTTDGATEEVEISQKVAKLNKNDNEVNMEIEGKISVSDEIDTGNTLKFIDNKEIVINIRKYVNPDYIWDRGIDFII